MAAFALLNGRLRLLNHPPRPSEDPLWLAAALPDLPSTAHVLDAGCGSGVLALAARIFQPHGGRLFTLLDVDPALVHLAANNATINRLPGRGLSVDFLTLSPDHVWDVILSNPPFHQQARGHHSTTRSLAHSAPPGLLEQWLNAALAHTTPIGQIHLVVHTDALPLLQPLCTGCAVAVRPLQTSVVQAPKRALLHLYKNQPTQWQVTDSIPTWQPQLRTQTLRQAERLPLA